MKSSAGFWKRLWNDRAYMTMCLPMIVLMVMFSYIPMFGCVLAFKKFDFGLGIWSSPWVGFDNFQYLFLVKDTFLRMSRNTIMYYLLFTFFGTLTSVSIAIAIDTFRKKKFGRFYQSCMILPTFISISSVTIIVYALLRSKGGLINSLIVSMGGSKVNWYAEADAWPIILLLVYIWKNAGYSSVMYLSSLSGLDGQMFEAAELDGANEWQKIRYITIPSLVPMIVLMTLLGLGNILHSDTGLFYKVTMNTGTLYRTTQVIDSYILNSISKSSAFGPTAAASFFQSVFGCVLVVSTNLIVRRFAPENSLF